MTHRTSPASLRSRLAGIAATIAVLVMSQASAAEAVVGRASADRVRARVVDLVNEARARGRKCGSERFAPAPPLSVSSRLNDAADRHARDMLKRKFFEHRGSDGSEPRDRVKRTGYESRLTGENIALGPQSAEEVVAGWLASPGHCENIMEPRFRDIGVGVAAGKKRGQVYWVQDFALPRRD
ncbi:MAG TPA: CAP domain-containing protein [Steroidobacteraceae bacterium]|nr:CAP domain-containing protein [Steroidobacteraceae bacterium]